MPIPPGSAQYPQDPDDFVGVSPADLRNNPSLAKFLTELGRAVEALEAKVGINDSQVGSALDFLMKDVNGGHHHDGGDSRLVSFGSLNGIPTAFPPSPHGLLDTSVHTGVPDGFPPSLHDGLKQNFAGAVMTKPGSQSIPDNNDTLVTWGAAPIDEGGYSNVGNNSMGIPSGYAGYYRVEARVAFAINSAGPRGAHMEKNGVPIDSDNCSSVNGRQTMLYCFWQGHAVATDSFKVFAYQNTNSGPLAMYEPACQFIITLLGV